MNECHDDHECVHVCSAGELPHIESCEEAPALYCVKGNCRCRWDWQLGGPDCRSFTANSTGAAVGAAIIFCAYLALCIYAVCVLLAVRRSEARRRKLLRKTAATSRWCRWNLQHSTLGAALLGSAFGCVWITFWPSQLARGSAGPGWISGNKPVQLWLGTLFTAASAFLTVCYLQLSFSWFEMLSATTNLGGTYKRTQQFVRIYTLAFLLCASVLIVVDCSTSGFTWPTRVYFGMLLVTAVVVSTTHRYGAHKMIQATATSAALDEALTARPRACRARPGASLELAALTLPPSPLLQAFKQQLAREEEKWQGQQRAEAQRQARLLLSTFSPLASS
jgi:hypothetical protein